MRMVAVLVAALIGVSIITFSSGPNRTTTGGTIVSTTTTIQLSRVQALVALEKAVPTYTCPQLYMTLQVLNAPQSVPYTVVEDSVVGNIGVAILKEEAARCMK